MSTALDLIKSAMRKVGVLTKTESPTSDEAVDALATLNAMLDSWANDSVNVPYRTLESFTLTAGTANYTIGTGGAFNTTKPILIKSAYLRDGTTDSPIDIISDEEYSLISQKATQGDPDRLNFSNAYPLATIRLYPVPSSAYTLYVLSEKIIGNYSLSTTVSLPPGWERAIVYQLAVELAPEYGQAVSNEVAAIALDSMSKIRRTIAKNRSLDTPTDGIEFNIYTGYS